MKPFNLVSFLLLASLHCLLPIYVAGLYYYPTAVPSAVWTNSPSMGTHYFSDGTRIRTILLQGGYRSTGPCFTCGFWCTGLCDFSLFSLIVRINEESFNNVYSPQVVWTANRDRPVKENATLEFSKDGDLILRDVDGSIVWSTNTAGKSVVGMNLTEHGNLILVDTKNKAVWSSMDRPTDCWLLGQTLRQGQRLTANVSVTNSTRGQLYLSIVDGGFETYVGDNPPQLYSRKLFDMGEIAQTNSTHITFTNGSLTIFVLSNYSGLLLNKSIPLAPASSFQNMRLDYGGHLRLYDLSIKGWQLLGDVLDDLPNDCLYPTACGEYGICSNGQCSCPATQYFKLVDERQPNRGCSLLTPISCQSNQTHQFFTVDGVSYFTYFGYVGADDILNTTKEGCKQACLKNCSCKAALIRYYGNDTYVSCYLASPLFSMAMESFTENSFAYIKVAVEEVNISSPPPTFSLPKGAESSKRKKVFMVGVTLGALFTASLVTIFIMVLVRRKKEEDFGEDEQFDILPGNPTRFSFEDLKVATENFCRKLGEGGFGSVFEGVLIDGISIAVKRLDSVSQGKKEFLAEVKTIGSIHHINLVRLIGFCAEKSYRLLVYEYMCNGSLDNWIFYKVQGSALDWQTRRRIITDIAKGLSYLHEECRQKIAHLDIKPQNILLDENFNAKISDFGLSKLIDRDQSHVMTRMRGTPGYLAPEWITSVITEKADVYSFGVVMLEIVCGRKNLDYSQEEESIHLISLLKDKVQKDRLSDLIDKQCADMQLHVVVIIEMMKLAMWCLQSDSSKRPSMSVVVKVLEGSMNVDEDIDHEFMNPAPFISRHAANNSSPSQSASLLSGPR